MAEVIDMARRSYGYPKYNRATKKFFRDIGKIEKAFKSSQKTRTRRKTYSTANSSSCMLLLIALCSAISSVILIL